MGFVSQPVHAQSDTVAIRFCSYEQQKGGRCITAANEFQTKRREPNRIYVNWTLPQGRTVKQWTRRWSFYPGGNAPTTCLFSTSSPLKSRAVAGGQLYQIVFSASEGNGPKVFNTPELIYGDYTLELFADGQPAGRATFRIRAYFAGDEPIKASLC